MQFPIQGIRSLSAITNYFVESSKIAVEGMWYGFHIATEVLRKRASRIGGSVTAADSGLRHVVSMRIGVMDSMPIHLDPIGGDYGFQVQPDDGTDLLAGIRRSSDPMPYQVTELVWKQIYGCTPQYLSGSVLVSSSDIHSSTKADWPLINTADPTMSKLPPLQYPVYVVDKDGGVWSMVHSMFYTNSDGVKRYYICTNHDFIVSSSQSLYCTTGLAYTVDPDILSLPELCVRTDDNGSDKSDNIVFVDGIDYRFWPITKTIEFSVNSLAVLSESYGLPCTMFCNKANCSNDDIFKVIGSSVDMSKGALNIDNREAAMLLSNLAEAYQASGDLSSYKRAVACHYGLPVADQDYAVVGQFETHGYLVIASLGIVSLQSRDAFISGRFLIGSTIYDVTSGVVAGGLASMAGSMAYREIKGWMSVYSCRSPNVATVQMSQASSSRLSERVASAAMMWQGATSMMAILKSAIPGYNGCFHIASVNGSPDSAEVSFYSYNPLVEVWPKFHDAPIATLSEGVSDVKMLIPDPNHKFIELVARDGTYRRFYIDAPLYSGLNAGDFVGRGDLLVENLYIEPMLKLGCADAVYELRLSGKLRHTNTILEVMHVNPCARYGEDFPDSVEVTL